MPAEIISPEISPEYREKLSALRKVYGNKAGQPIIVGCNYHTTWQRHSGMRFILAEIKGEKANLQTEASKSDFWVDVETLIFIRSSFNIDRATELTSTTKWSQTMREIVIEKIAAGLRAISKTPAAFLFIDGGNPDTWDEPEILGIPVFHGRDLNCHRWDSHWESCRFIPVGVREEDITSTDRERFSEAYNDFHDHQGGRKLCIVEGN